MAASTPSLSLNTLSAKASQIMSRNGLHLTCAIFLGWVKPVPSETTTPISRTGSPCDGLKTRMDVYSVHHQGTLGSRSGRGLPHSLDYGATYMYPLLLPIFGPPPRYPGKLTETTPSPSRAHKIYAQLRRE